MTAASGSTGYSFINAKAGSTPVFTVADTGKTTIAAGGLVVTFEWRRDEFRSRNFPNGVFPGFIADEVQEILPDLVHEDGDGWKSLNYVGLVPHLVRSVQEMQAQLAQMQLQIDALQAHSWVGHDVTFLLLHMGLTVEAADDAASIASYLDREWPLEALQGDEKDVQRRRDLLKEWIVRFHSRYEVVAQLSDRYGGEHWDVLRDELLPESKPSSGGKCPLGFGAKVVSNVVSRKSTDVDELRTIMFQGRCYDVMDSRLFRPEGGQFAHFVGHDVTYALAVQSTRVEDLDVTPERAYTFEEQLMLEKYRSFFARELAVLEIEEHHKGNDSQNEVVNLHAVIEESDSMAQELSIQNLQKALANASVEQVDEVCIRTTMTPLHKAVEKHRLDLVTLLVHAGADFGARAALYDDETPLEMARRFQFDDIVAHLESIAVGSK
ncbi:hypothetical protein BBP00_00004200 [Phytophthora kernoviae]|uniref:Peptidase S74 domain-containing protein n=1 Tax=Phytophthora kernoviae TaxID=325452 RepID=A0A3F2RSG0_9STRA|nr:hypothetical protein BBP00_00004200 [Phytophthora kernoviae]